MGRPNGAATPARGIPEPGPPLPSRLIEAVAQADVPAAEW